MRSFFTKIGTGILIIIIVYFLVNLIHLIWIIVRPEGYWSVLTFLGILSSAIILLLIIVGGIINIASYFYSKYKDPNHKISLREIYQVLGLALLILIIYIGSGFLSEYVNIFFHKSMADKYSYLNKTEELLNEGKYQKAESYARKAFQKESTIKDPPRILILSYLYAQFNSFKFSNAQRLYNATLGYATCLSVSPELTDSSLNLFRSALNQAMKAPLNKEEELKLLPLQFIAEIANKTGQFPLADSCFTESFNLMSSSTKDEFSYVLQSQMIFANYLGTIGDIKKEAIVRLKTLEFYENEKPKSTSSLYLGILSSAAISSLMIGNVSSAERILSKAESFADKHEETEMYLYFMQAKASFSSKAVNLKLSPSAFYRAGFWEKVFSGFQQKKMDPSKFWQEQTEKCLKYLCERIIKETGPNSLQSIAAQARLADFYIAASNFKEADRIYSVLLEENKTYKAKNTALYYQILLKNSILQSYQGTGSNLIANLKECEQFFLGKINENVYLLTANEREGYIQEVMKNIRHINSLYAHLNDSFSVGFLYNNLLAGKAASLYANQYIRNSINKAGLDSTFEGLLSLKQKFQFNQTDNPTQVPLPAEIIIRNQEKSILDSLSRIKAYTPFNIAEITWHDVKNNLAANEYALEFIHLPSKPHLPDSIVYYALLIGKNYLSPKLITICNEGDINTIINKGGSLKERMDSIYIHLQPQLVNLLWNPIEKHLPKNAKVFVSLSGILNNLSFSAILADKPVSITFLSSTRQIVFPNKDKKKQNFAAFWGAMNYDYLPKRANKAGTKKNNRAGLTAQKEIYFKDLNYTDYEISQIAQQFFNELKDSSELYKGDKADEASFYRITKNKYNILHIATHGFYFLGNANNRIGNSLFGSSNSYETALNKVGLAFSGANNANQLPPSNDGIVTGLDISKMYFPNLDMAVISACESGLGDLQGDEGIYGLQRAFMLAGARSTLVSLWNISDKHTAELMLLFYKNLKAGMSKSESLNQAQKHMRITYPSPFYWAGYVLFES